MVANPFATTDGDGAIDLTSPAAGDQNVYYRRVKVANIMQYWLIPIMKKGTSVPFFWSKKPL